MTTEGASRRAPGMAQVAGEQFSLAEAVGGWWAAREALADPRWTALSLVKA